MKASNPYKWNRVHLDLFYGRESLLEELISGMLNGQSFALMGGRRIGKTTLLRKIEYELHSRLTSLMDGGLVVIPVYVDTLSFADLTSPDIISDRILEATTEFVSRHLTYDSKNRSLEHDPLNPFAQELLSLIERISEYRVQIVVLFDEISPVVYADWGTTYLGNWRALLHNTPPLSNYISATFAGAREIVNLANDVSSPLANILSWKCLQSFSVADTRLLVEEPTALDLPDDFHTRVYEYTGGHPFLIQYLMFHVLESGSSDLYQALDDACTHFIENEHRQFQAWCSDFDDITWQIYEMISSEGAVKKRALVRFFEDSGVQTQVQSCLNVLCSYGIVHQINDQTYKWSGELFRSWYIENCRGRTRLPGRIVSSAEVDHAFWNYWNTRLADLSTYNILVEGETDKLYLQIAAERYQEATEVDLLEGGKIQIVTGRGTKRIGPEFGMLQSLENQGIKYVVILDGDHDGQRAAEAMDRFGAQKNLHYFLLSRPDYRDKSGKSWDVEIEDILPQSLIEGFVLQHPDAVEEQLQRQDVTKYTIRGCPLEKEGRTYDYKMMLVEYVRQRATLGDLTSLIEVLKKARKCMGIKER